MSMELLIYEHDEQVGTVDLTTETSTYDGANTEIENVLREMETEGFMSRVPVREYTDEKGRRNRVTRREKRTGADLGRFLVGAIEEEGRNDEVRTETIGFDREYPTIEVGDYPDSESADDGTQSEDTSTDSQEEASTSKEPAPSNPSG